MKTVIIGREQELSILKKTYSSSRSEFVAVYGRRRVGKTFLVREFFKNRFSFHCTGLAEGKTKAQLKNFNIALSKYAQESIPQADNWLDAFEQLIVLIESRPERRKVIFLDELPWMDTARSGFIAALEHFWNDWASARKDIVLIVCGSATSWMMDKLIGNKGGLHNRLTNRILVKPFTLSECESYFKSRRIKMSRYQIAECYMIMGGIPYYLDYIDREYSLNENIDRLFFQEGGQMGDEFDNLYSALFKNSQQYEKVVELLSKKGMGLSREELSSVKKGKSGSGMTTILKNLEKCGFIRSYLSFGQKTRDKLYQLTDPYTLFYFHFIRSGCYNDQHFWTNALLSGELNAWRGYSFEILCLCHEQQIKQALGISGVMTNVSAWRSKVIEPGRRGAQIDLLIDHKDAYINLCEMKFSKKEYSIDRKDKEDLENKIEAFQGETKTRHTVLLTMVTTFGVKANSYSDIVQKTVVLDDLF